MHNKSLLIPVCLFLLDSFKLFLSQTWFHWKISKSQATFFNLNSPDPLQEPTTCQVKKKRKDMFSSELGYKDESNPYQAQPVETAGFRCF